MVFLVIPLTRSKGVHKSHRSLSPTSSSTCGRELHECKQNQKFHLVDPVGFPKTSRREILFEPTVFALQGRRHSTRLRALVKKVQVLAFS